MNARAIAAVLLVLSAVAVVLLVTSGSDDDYKVSVRLANANGLREGSPVSIGGVEAGKISDLRIEAGDQLEAEVKLDDGRGPIPGGARVLIAANNLLGEKTLRFVGGDRAKPLPSGALVPGNRVVEDVDLDQVLDVLDAPTRLKLQILINEVGRGFAGRRSELNKVLAQLPPSLSDVQRLVAATITDNRTLGRLIDRSDRFIATFARARKRFATFVSTGGAAAETIAARRRELAQTLRQAPSTLARLRVLLADLESTARPLRPAARKIAATAPQLTATLGAVPSFERAVRPVLSGAERAAPDLTKLGIKATPVVARARPTLQALDSFSEHLAPVSRTLDLTIEDLIGTLQGWSRAIQGRDGLSHIFRASVKVNVDQLRTMLLRLVPDAAPHPRSTPRKRPTADRDDADTRPQAQEQPAPPRRRLPLPSVPPLSEQLERPQQALESVLDFVLGP